jgi:DNA-binding LytR/AlgR family response regulator
MQAIMEPKQILIIEDEVHNQRLLQGMLAQIRPQWVVVALIDSVYDAVEWFTSNKADLIFMDIQLVDGICFSIFERTSIQSPVIFTTAYDNFAIQAFKVNSIDYLLKPIKDEDLLKAIDKFEQLHVPKNTTIDYHELLHAIKHGEKKYRTRFMIQSGLAYTKLLVNEIAYFYSENKITYAVTLNRKEYHVDFTMDSLEEELDPEQFFRTNRHLLVHIDSVVKFEDYYGGKLVLKLSPPFKETITISRLKNSQFKEWVGK